MRGRRRGVVERREEESRSKRQKRKNVEEKDGVMVRE